MFAPEIAKARTKTAESQVNNLARRGSTLVERSFASEVVDQPHMFPARSIDNQTALRLLSQRDFRPTGKGARGDHGQEVEQVSMTARGTTPGVSWNFSKIPIFRPGLENQPEARFLGSAVHLPGIIQPKLAVGRVNDPLEREADRAAEHVMRMPYPVTTSASGDKVLQRKCEACEEEDKEDPSKSTRSTSHDAAAFDGMTAPTSVHEVLRSPGQALEPSTRGFFERRFGHDFSNIRVHTDSLAATSARSVGALAYTVG